MARLRFACISLALACCAVASAQEKIRVANEGGIRDAWTLAPGAKLSVPAYPAEYADAQAEACVAIGYLLNADGSTSDFALLKAWSASEPKQGRDAYWAFFAKSASGALSLWHFQPRHEVTEPRPVYTVATFVFASANVLETRKRCGIPNLAMHIAKLRQDSKVRRRMSGNSLFDSLDIDHALESRYRDQQYQLDAIRQKNVQSVPPPPPPSNPPSGG